MKLAEMRVRLKISESVEIFTFDRMVHVARLQGYIPDTGHGQGNHIEYTQLDLETIALWVGIRHEVAGVRHILLHFREHPWSQFICKIDDQIVSFRDLDQFAPWLEMLKEMTVVIPVGPILTEQILDDSRISAT